MRLLHLAGWVVDSWVSQIKNRVIFTPLYTTLPKAHIHNIRGHQYCISRCWCKSCLVGISLIIKNNVICRSSYSILLVEVFFVNASVSRNITYEIPLVGCMIALLEMSPLATIKYSFTISRFIVWYLHLNSSLQSNVLDDFFSRKKLDNLENTDEWTYIYVWYWYKFFYFLSLILSFFFVILFFLCK